MPQGLVLRLARADGRVLDKAGLDGVAEDCLEPALQVGLAVRGRELDQRVPGVVAGERPDRAAAVLHDDVDGEARQELEGGERVSRPLPQAREGCRARCAPSGTRRKPSSWRAASGTASAPPP
jgi:hypothetical protein